MKALSVSLKKGDIIDRETARVLEEFCQQEFTCKTFEEYKAESNFNELTTKQKYKEALEIEAATYFPVAKISKGKYLIGTKEKQLQINDKGCLVKCVRGFKYLPDYLKHSSRQEFIDLNNLLQKNDYSFSNTVAALMK